MEELQMKTKLGVNIDHSATLRQARYREVPQNSPIIVEPDVVKIARLAELGGADSITAHLREDRRHMADADLFALRENVNTKLNMEMACASGVLEVALKVRPDYACLVPENRREVTTEGGLDVLLHRAKVAETVAALSEAGVVCSLFIDPDFRQIEAAKQIGAPVIELHTGAYANAWNSPNFEAEFLRIKKAMEFAGSLGLVVNAGHGLNYQNVSKIAALGGFNEFNIGHTIVAKALECGFAEAVRQMKELIEKC